MTPKLLARKVKLRAPFKLKSLPFLSRFHRLTSRSGMSRKKELVVKAPLEKLFSVYRRGMPMRATGELEYQSPTGPKTIQFNAHNLAFDMFYADAYADNYEDETGLLIDTFLPLDGCFYDIGANFGFFSLYVASRGGKGKIHAFEPTSSTFVDLKSCVEQAGMADRIQCHNMAASDADGEIEFQESFHSAGARVGAGGGVKVRAARMDSLGMEPPDFLKIDAEEHEASVLKGCEGLLRTKKPFVMFESKFIRSRAAHALEPMNLLTRNGYEIFTPTVLRHSAQGDYLLCCGYQENTHRNLKIEQEDLLVLLPCDPMLRTTLQPDLNLFACHRDRMSELHQQFHELPSANK